MKTLSLIMFLSLSWTLLQAQTITNSYFPSANTTKTIVYVKDNVFQGDSGVGQSWYFAPLTPLYSESTRFVTPSQAPEIDSFPGTTVASIDSNGQYDYYTVTAEKVVRTGFVLNSTTAHFAQSQIFAHFPLIYGARFNDSSSFSYELDGLNGVMDYHFETNAILVDGSGTITTPEGIFTNVLRMKTVRYTWDSMPFSIPSTDTSVIYEWIQDGISNPVFQILNSSFAGSFASYQSNITTGIGTLNYEDEITISPNPVSQELAIINMSPNMTAFSMCNIEGTHEVNGNIAGMSLQRLNLSDFAVGVYVITFFNETKRETKKLVITR